MLLISLWHYSQFQKERNAEILARLLQFKIPTKVRLALYIHKQELFEGKMGNCLSPSLVKIELAKVVITWEIDKGDSDTYTSLKLFKRNEDLLYHLLTRSAIEPGDKITDVCKYPFPLFSISEGKGCRKPSKIA